MEIPLNSIISDSRVTGPGQGSLEKRTPSDIHRCEVLLVSCLHDQLIHLPIDREGNGLFRHEAPKFVANVVQDAGRRIGYVGMSATLW